MDDYLFDAFDDDPGGTKRAASTPAEERKRAKTDIVIAPAPWPLAATTATMAADEPIVDPTAKACKHEVGMPSGEKPTQDMLALTVSSDYVPAREYKFELDPFQKAAVACIERDESVLVSAHTSAGKTVCAEYAIATSLRAQQRVLYTSPIKALSNQKYRELKEEFGSTCWGYKAGLQSRDRPYIPYLPDIAPFAQQPRFQIPP